MLDRILLNSLLTSFSFVCPWNWGLLKKIEIITAVSENISSIINSCDFLIPDSSPQFLNPFKIDRLVQFYKDNKIDTVIFNGPKDLKLGGKAAKKAGVKNIIYRT